MAGIAQNCAALRAAGSDPALCRALLSRLSETLAGRRMRFMEVCGTHTVAIFQSGLRSLLPAAITHISGPGCPVCVTHETEVAQFLDLARRDDVIIAAFGDLLRVPGPDGFSLKHASANGAHIAIVYSPLQALDLARANPAKKIVFPGIGFETTAPAVAACLLAARKQRLRNFFVLCLHKRIAPALKALLASGGLAVDAFLLPGHVATITGLAPFEFISSDFNLPAVVSGFEPADILLALCGLAEGLDRPQVANAYRRAAADEGNSYARALLERVFAPASALWRGLGEIPEGGYAIKPKFADHDAARALDLSQPEEIRPSGCLCGQILKGQIAPPDCPLFGKKCSPAHPVGPCMVSSEGSCAAWYRYGAA